MFADGSNGSVELSGNQITIRRKGVANMITQGFQGDKSIPLGSITAVQFRAAGSWMAGCIQFTLLGGQEFRGGMMQATMDENAVMFTREQQPGFEKLREVIQDAISTAGSAVAATGKSVTEELAELAALVEQGYVTRDEFDARKSLLLGAGSASAASTSHAPREEAPRLQSRSGSETAPRSGRAKWVIAALVGLVLLSTQAGQLLPDPGSTDVSAESSGTPPH